MQNSKQAARWISGGNDSGRKLDQLLAQGKLSELEELFFYYLKKVQNLHSTDTFIKTPEFVQVFGDAELTGEYSCAKMSNIDLVPANILILKDRQVVIDYEWTFDFPVPAGFILYR